MNQNYPSIKISTKDLRLLLRRINKCIRDLDSSTVNTNNGNANNNPASQLGPEALQKLSDLIYSKAVQGIYLQDEMVANEDPEIILSELI